MKGAVRRTSGANPVYKNRVCSSKGIGEGVPMFNKKKG
jgi:hypothetical protein